MDGVQEMAERHGRILSRLAEMTAELAERVHADAMTAETPDERAKSAVAFHRLGRSLRQTLALEMRLAREARACRREQLLDARNDAGERLHARRKQVHAAVTRLIWTEHEPLEAEDLEADLDERLDEHAALDDDFADAPVEVLIARLAVEMGLKPPTAAHPRKGADPGGLAACAVLPDSS